MDNQTLSSEMLDELRDALKVDIPEGALSFKEIYDALGGKNEKKTRQAISKLVADGAWGSKRYGTGKYYWKVTENTKGK